mmetsp:Transcript_19135/g.33170  ORF Transcript_19135/g.33170 Transcript_19135/m.33170 type:complete len:106 (-) Transcript_19135:84-401(-)
MNPSTAPASPAKSTEEVVETVSLGAERAARVAAVVLLVFSMAALVNWVPQQIFTPLSLRHIPEYLPESVKHVLCVSQAPVQALLVLPQPVRTAAEPASTVITAET